MRNLLVSLIALLVVLSACSSAPVETGSGGQVEPSATTDSAADTPTSSPTPLVIPTTDVASTPTATPSSTPAPTQTPAPTPDAATAVPTAQPTATATPRPIPTAVPTVPAPTPTPRPIPTATPAPATPTAVPTPTPVWVNPDCYVGPGAADEPVWWCDARICVVGAPHYGCPTGPPVRPHVRIDCTISDNDIAVGEIITLTAVQNPANTSIRFAFAHGDGTIDNTSVSRAFYEAPGTYRVTLLWQYAGGKGSKACGTVRVRSTGTPTPTPTPTPAVVQIGCSISPTRTVQVNEFLTLTAFQNPAHVAVSYVFDHGDGTLDPTAQSQAYYAAPGFYDVRLNWAHGDQSGTTFCGTVTVEPNFDDADYVGLTAESAKALATSRGLETRVVRIDDQVFPGTTDYRLDRINIEIDANKVTRAYLG